MVSTKLKGKNVWLHVELDDEERAAMVSIQRKMRPLMDIGVICPCCRRKCKVYKQRISSTMAATLYWMHRRSKKNGGKYIRMSRVAPKWAVAAPERARLAKWGLIKAKPLGGEKGRLKNSGKWKITQKGIDFCKGKIAVEKYVWLLNNVVIERSEETTDLQSCLSNKFDYSALMRGEYDDLESIPRR